MTPAAATPPSPPTPRAAARAARTRSITDAAIQVLGEGGPRALTHLAVDDAAELPRGSTSYYFRTRESLLHATADRVVEHDLASLARAMHHGDGSARATLARIVGEWLTGEGRVRTRARLHLFLLAPEDEALAEKLRSFRAGFIGLGSEFSATFTAGRALERPEITAVTTYLDGVFLVQVSQDLPPPGPAEIDALLAPILQLLH